MNKQLQDLLITIVAGMGMLLSTLDTGIINIASVSYTHLPSYFYFHRPTSYLVRSLQAINSSCLLYTSRCV